MPVLKTHTLGEIERKLRENRLPFSGITELGSSEFHFTEPSSAAGIVMHAGSRMRPELADLIMPGSEDRYREEDPFADAFIEGLPLRIIARDSRFEYDLNREEESCIYPFGEQKYGLDIWSRPLTDREQEPALLKFREFYQLVDLVLEYMLGRNRKVLIFDLHTYCYQRLGKATWYEDPNPEINIGTGAVNHGIFSGAIQTFISDLAGVRIEQHPVRVAENAVFQGGYLSRRLSKAWHDRVLVLAIEYKKIFMDEWTGELYPDRLEQLVARFRKASDNMIKFSAATHE
jgi:hypothetical protein